MDNQTDFGNPATRVAVGAAGGAYTYLGLPLDKWVAVLTIVYLLISIINALPKLPENYRKVRDWLKTWRKRE